MNKADELQNHLRLIELALRESIEGAQELYTAALDAERNRLRREVAALPGAS